MTKKVSKQVVQRITQMQEHKHNKRIAERLTTMAEYLSQLRERDAVAENMIIPHQGRNKRPISCEQAFLFSSWYSKSQGTCRSGVRRRRRRSSSSLAEGSLVGIGIVAWHPGRSLASRASRNMERVLHGIGTGIQSVGWHRERGKGHGERW